MAFETDSAAECMDELLLTSRTGVARLPEGYQKWLAYHCVHCKAGLRKGSGYFCTFHFDDENTARRCTAPNVLEYIAQLEASQRGQP